MLDTANHLGQESLREHSYAAFCKRKQKLKY
jgi:hypothetical protein